ncbi:MAG: hypothetical protein ABI577_03575 [bacterium]
MSRYEDSCPVESTNRAERCNGCLMANPVPPCVSAFLGGKVALPVSNVIQLRRIEVVEVRRAA